MYFQGSGTRTGNGKCDCDDGYQGDKCNECSDGFYDDGNQTCSSRWYNSLLYWWILMCDIICFGQPINDIKK